MSNRTHINNELQSVAPGLINIPVAMPFSLPPAYFSGLASELLHSINKEEHLPVLLTNLSKAIPYTLPVGYFEQLPDLILQKVRLSSASNQETSVLNQLSQANPYAVPTDYFENFPKSVLQKIREEDQRKTLPAGYFDSLSDKMLAKVRKLDTSKELEEIAPLLNTISKQPVQHVPIGYFENLEPKFPVESSNEVHPVISIKRKTNWLKYAVAACLVGILGFNTYQYFESKTAASLVNQPSTTVINDQLAKLDATTIEAYLQTNSATTQNAFPASDLEELNNSNLDELLQGFTDQQLKKHIEEAPDLPAAIELKSHS